MRPKKETKSASQTLKAIGSAFLHNREIGIQEAVYRVCTLKMKECSRKVVFIPVGENPVRLSKPLSQIKPNDESENGEQDNWMRNIVDRYYDRPETDEFNTNVSRIILLCIQNSCQSHKFLKMRTEIQTYFGYRKRKGLFKEELEQTKL